MGCFLFFNSEKDLENDIPSLSPSAEKPSPRPPGPAKRSIIGITFFLLSLLALNMVGVECHDIVDRKKRNIFIFMIILLT